MSPGASAVHRSRRAARARARVITIALLLLLSGVTIVFLMPIVWMLSTSLKSNRHVFDLPIQWLPDRPLWGNYPHAYTTVRFTRYFVNSAIVTGCVTLLNVLLSALAGYGLAKYRFLGRHALLVLILATLMLPLEVVMVPLYLTVQRLGWLDSYQGMIVPVAANALGVLMMRQYFLSLPDDLIAAARIDGAGHVSTFLRIGVPLAWPALLTVAILIFQSTWDDFVWPFLIISNTAKATVPLAVQTFQSAETSDFPMLMAVSCIASLPLTLLFFVFQRQIISGVATTGMRH
ncbi:MAG TPA: carbohydrate ABC transporter permease [bacterium]|nr:carbohydrate ABC transporter permease [bacterium]